MSYIKLSQPRDVLEYTVYMLDMCTFTAGWIDRKNVIYIYLPVCALLASRVVVVWAVFMFTPAESMH